MNKLAIALFHVFLVFFFSPKPSDGQGLRPQPINIAQGKKIEATATCGEDVSEPELFCKLATVPGKLGILGLSCDHCEPGTPTKDHSIKYAIDGTERWWQSPPLSRGLQYQKVNITIDLGQEYQVAYVIVKAGNAPRPGTWALERSVDGGKTFHPWQYFATTNSECLSYFGSSALLQSFKDDTTVTCTTSYSQVPPFENGEIHISLINGRPGAANFSYSQALQEWTRATHIRLRLLKVKTLLADLLPLARKDPSVTRRYFYSIKDISVGGICMCNGHADECIQSAEDSLFRCRCKHQTCGIKCEECCPGFVQKKWRPGTAESSNECEACNCHNHAIDCYYSEEIDQQKRSLDLNGNYEGGGVCVNCQHNTVGINCEQCKAGYYRPADKAKTDRDACKVCTCDRRFSTGRCFDGDGQCQCLENYSGPNCTQCNEGFYGFPNCKPCDCHPLGTSGRVCGPTGDQCPCKPNYTGAKCDQCARGYYGFPNCFRCNCDNLGSLSADCDVSDGQCRCRQMYTSRQCNQCSKGFYSFPECKVCNCDAEGTARDICDPTTGECICMKNYAGPRCDICNEGYYNFPRCSDCGCSREGSLLPACDPGGRCVCKDNYDGLKCDGCKIGFYSYPRCVKCSCDLRGSVHEFCEPTSGQCQCKGSFRGINCNRCRSGFYGFPDCQACQCNPAGIKPLPDGQAVDCSLSNEGQCDCKDNVQGLACTGCKDGYYFLDSNNPLGCDSCECNMDGVIGGLRICDKETGQCPCKLYVAGRKCTQCKPGFYGLKGRKVFGCTGCDCDVGGAYDQLCDVDSGQCRCRVNVVGRDCSRPATQHYYPTLLQIKAEMEDGMALPTKSTSDQDVLSPDVSVSNAGQPARFGFDESVFPGFSWRGYATMSDIQRAIKVTLDIPKTARYHIIFYSITNESSPVTGEVMLTPKGGEGSKQSSKVTFPVKQAGLVNTATHHTVGVKERATQFMLTKGKWDMILALPPTSILLDYVVALPQVYYEAYQLEEKVDKPCQVNGINTLCNQFSYLSTKAPGFFTTELETGYIVTSSGVRSTQLFRDEQVLQQLDFSAMANLDNQQTRVTAEFGISKIGKYVLVLQYYYPNDKKTKVSVYLRYRRGSQRGEFNLQRCNYRFGCRQVAVDSTGAVKVFDVADLDRKVVTLLARDTSSPIAVDSVTAIPLDVWDLDFIAPSILCTTQGNVCIPTSYPNPKGAVTIEVPDASDPDQPQPPNKQDPTTKLLYLGEGIHSMSKEGLKEGQYAAIVHYYQPKHSSFESQVKVTSDRAVEGSLKFHYCPHASGCRSVIKNLAGLPFFDIERKTVALEFEIPMNSSTWIDYVLLVPQNMFTEDLQEDAPVPLSQAFLDSCSKDDFFITTTDPKFCKDSVFSLTTSFNNGSLPCDCNPKGSVHNNCETFGGQCHCRQNVIGRTCNRCKTGYYGFPECRRCRCVYCNEITGACDCPKNTVGPNCEFCLQGTCCYDPILGCEDCGCERFGVVGNNIACNPNTGQCNCKPSHTGKKCKKCAVGYFNYPLCQKCETCDPRGVDSRICDSDSGTCFCKPGVTGPRCDKCAAGHFNLDANNPDGCSECWCNGLSKVCDSGNMYWSKINTMDNWKLENSPAIVVKIAETELSASVSSQRDEKGQPIYWVAPSEYLGQKISSYGGKLNYTISYEVPQGESSPVLTTKPDVVLEGKNGKVLLYKKQLELSPGQTSAVEAQFLEYLWEDASGSNVSRDDFMSVFHDIKSLKLRASYSTVVAEVRLSEVEMDVAVDERVGGAVRAKSVERCECPAKATGDSCELCGKGYTRAPDNTSCVPCNCFGHSEDCDGETGECFGCLHNTTGLNCEVCEPGFYGDASTGTPVDCNICECPLGIISNSFATECSLNVVSDLICTCKEGYVGQNCERCADGFFGNPSDPGDFCKRCGCSGNIDHSVNGSCDTLTGECLKCNNAATGDQCQHCLNGYFGDAVVAKNCARCACNDCGTVTAVCNHTTGSCMCKPNVIGDSCDSCKPNTWNFDSCLGCEDCDCASASLSTSCDVKTGQCECPQGVTGRRCDRCKAGYFEYTKDGCRACACDKGEDNLYGFCDVNTGQCCKPGGNCTICPVNYILTSEGCQYCGECVGRLLKTATELDRNLTLALKVVKQGTAGIIAEGQFSDLNETLQRLIPLTNEYNSTMEELSQVVGMSLANATNTSSGGVDEDNTLIKRTDSAEEIANNVETMIVMITDKAKIALENSTSTKEEALELEEEIRTTLNRTTDIIVMAEKIAKTLQNEKANQTLLLEKAEEILKELLERDFESANATMVEEGELVMTVINRAKKYLNDTKSLLSKVMGANKTLDELLGTFSSILDESNRVLENVSHAVGFNNISKTYDSQTPLEEAVHLKKEVDTALNNLEDVIQTAKDKEQNASTYLQDFNGSFPRLDDLIKQVDEKMANISQILDELSPSVIMAQNRSRELRNQADDLEKLLTDIEFARKAYNASERYSNIAEALKEALAIAQEAEKIAMEAKDESQSLSSRADNSLNVSVELNETVSSTEDKVDNELLDLLNNVKTRLALIKAKIRNVSTDLLNVDSNFPRFQELTDLMDGKGRELQENATESETRADDAREKAENIEDQLSDLSGLKDSIVATNSNITEAEKQVMNGLNMSLVIRDKVLIQEKRHQQIVRELDAEVKQRLKAIELMMDNAHNLLKFTTPVMKFEGDTTSSPLLPPAIKQKTRAMNILMYLKPEKPDGLVMFLGDADGTNTYRQKRQSQQSDCRTDYIAVLLKERKPRLKICTAAKGIVEVGVRDKGNDFLMQTDGKVWYKLEASVAGDLVDLTIKYFVNKKEESASGQRSLKLDNPKIEFNKDSDLIVGGVPAKVKLPSNVETVNYTGCLDGLEINYHYVGSWNTESLEKTSKDEVCPSRTGPSEFAAYKEDEPVRTFFGTGYVKSGPYQDEDPMGNFDLKFRTTSSNGILVIAIDDDDTSLFQALELVNGRLVLSYNMGHGYKKLTSTKLYDNGMEFIVVKQDLDNRGFRFSLIIRSEDGKRRETLASSEWYYDQRRPKFVNADFVYWGGIENRTTIPVNVTKSFFKGCLSGMKLSSGDIKVQPSPGYLFGCKVKPAHNVTFLGERSYLAIKPLLNKPKRGFNIGLSFRVDPKTKNGLILLETRSDGTEFISLGINDEKLRFSANPGNRAVSVTSTARYSDGKWHFVSVIKDGFRIYLRVDDEDPVDATFVDQTQQLIQTTSKMYLGGVPENRMDSVRSNEFDSAFLNSLKGGSIRDLTFDHELFDLEKYEDRRNVIFDDDDYSESSPKLEIIEKPPDISTTTAPSNTTAPPSNTTELLTTPPPVCSMPEEPARDSAAGVLGFGYDINSHAMYTVTGNRVLFKLKSETTDLSFDFRASNPDGIILYTASDNIKQADFIVCNLLNGKVSCGFSAGGGILQLTSPDAVYSDGTWHTVRLTRMGVDGELFVDGKIVKNGTAAGSPRFINGLKELYLGGTPEGFDAKRVKVGARISFPGCIRNVKVNDADIGKPTSLTKGVQNCYLSSPASGVSFDKGGGYLKVADTYTVGMDEEISMEIKATSHTGLLLSSSNVKGDYIVLEIIRGNVIFRAENGGGQLVVEYTAEDPLQLCDGQWHKIKAWKDGNLVKLQVDEGTVLEGERKGSQSNANIYDPLYVGGLPPDTEAKGVTATGKYTGCIRNLRSKDLSNSAKSLKLANPKQLGGNVYLGGCPYN